MGGTPILIVVGGLPATGKSTVASALARQAGFAFVRVDRIEQAIIGSAGLRPWDRDHLVIDTAASTPAAAAAAILATTDDVPDHVPADRG